jgi:large subunit ribosomal protein L33
MAKGAENRIIIKLKSSESGYTYTTVKNKKNDQGRLELKKYDPLVRKHVLFKEAK